MSLFDAMLNPPFTPIFKDRNVALDHFFYDTGNLSSTEQKLLSEYLSEEGSILMVPPGDSGQSIQHYPTAEEFLKDHKNSLKAVVVAGVGSSALGTAALARNVANTYQVSVAGIVSGFGLRDLIYETLGGFYFYGAVDTLRRNAQQTLSLVGMGDQHTQYLPDLHTLEQILAAEPPRLRLALGHSKGDFVLDYALETFVKHHEATGHAYFDELNVVTLGAAAHIPPEFTKVKQFIGNLDWFGCLNSSQYLGNTYVNFSGHHLNTQLPFHLDVEALLQNNVSLD